MKFSNKIFNDNSDEENEDLEEEDDEFEEEQSQDDADDNDEDERDDDEGVEVEDDEDFVEESENIAFNAIDKKDALARQSLGGGNKKIILKKTSSLSSKKPKTQQLVDEAIHQLKERAGSSSEAIKKYIMSKYPELDEKLLKRQMKRYIKNCITDGTMMQIKRSFKLTNKHQLKKKLGDKQKVKKQKEKEKLKMEKRKEKKTEEKKIKKQKAKENVETTKRSKAEAIDETKTKPVKKPKLDKASKMPASLSEGKSEKKKSKPIIKLGRRSINLVVRPTPPRPKTMKKTKATAVAGKKKIDFPADDDAATNTASSTVKVTGKGKKK